MLQATIICLWDSIGYGPDQTHCGSLAHLFFGNGHLLGRSKASKALTFVNPQSGSGVRVYSKGVVTRTLYSVAMLRQPVRLGVTQDPRWVPVGRPSRRSEQSRPRTLGGLEMVLRFSWREKSPRMCISDFQERKTR